MARHATPSAFSSGLPTGGARNQRRRPSSSRPARSSVSTSGRILVAAVAAGAALPAVQTLGTHIADADAAGAADLSLAASTGPAVRQATHTAPPATSAATTGAPRAGWSSVTPVVAGAERSSRSSDGGSAGDADDVSSLTKAMGMARENGPLEFGRPYTAGDEESLDGQIEKALGLMGLPQKLAPGVKKIIMRESTGNADAVNDWDSNAAAGTPSKGLMQLIDTTFENAVLPSLEDKGVFDPVANITAGVRTMIANHSIDDVMQGGRKNSSGSYIGYGGAKVPSDGLG